MASGLATATPGSAVSPASAFSLPTIGRAFGRLRREEPALFWTAAAHLALSPVLLALMPFDARTVLGIDPWVKPLKFFVSVAVYAATVGLLLLPLREGRARAFVRWATVVPLTIENVIIAAQSARGVTSHFNDATALDAALFGVMGLAILVTTASAVALLVMHARSRALAPAVAWGVRAGILVSLVGSAVGGAMVGNEGHAVGAEEDAEGLPVVNWSREGGDLRIAHFAGLHALQALPLVGLAVAGMPARRGVAVVAVATLAYALVVGALFAGAMLGQPLLGR